MVENVPAKVADEKIVEAVVVVVADADALSPAGMYETGRGSDVSESAVTIIFEEMRMRFLTFWKTLQARRQPLTRKMSSQPS